MEQQTNNIEQHVHELQSKIHNLKQRQSELSIEEYRLTKPRLTDITVVGNIYDMFCAFENDEGELPLRQKKFLFVIIYLYCPAAFAGGRMRRGLRVKVSNILGCTCSNISHDYKSVSFYYNTYKNFKTDCNKVMEYILERLEGRNYK